MNWEFKQYECRCFNKIWTQVMLKVTNHGKTFPSPHFCIFIPFFSLFLENAIHLTTLLTTNSKSDFPFLYFFTSTTPFRSEPALRDHTCDAPFMTLFVFYPLFFLLYVTYSLYELNVTSIVSNLWRKPNGVYWTKDKAEYNKIWIQCRYPLVAYPIKESSCIKFFDRVRIDR